MLAGVVYLIAGVALALTREGFDLTRHPLRLLMLGERGWLQRANLGVSGLITITAAVGFARREWSREVFEHERFDEALAGYGYKEDIDFSYRVSRRYVLVQTPKARCDHLKSPSARLNSHNLQRMNLANQFYLHRKNMPQTFRYKAALWWALVGTFLLMVGKAIQTRDRGHVTGMIVGAWEQARGRGLIDPTFERDREAAGG